MGIPPTKSQANYLKHLLFPVALLLFAFACNSKPETPEKPRPAPVIPSMAEVPAASARPQTMAPDDKESEPSVVAFERSMLSPQGLWSSHIEDLEVVKKAIGIENWIQLPFTEDCKWEPLQNGESYEWTWINCYENALALFHRKQGTWTLLKVPKAFNLQLQKGCGERYIGAREYVIQEGQVGLIWSWEYKTYLQSEEFSEECDEDGNCSAGRTGQTSSRETLHGYDVVMKSDDATPYLVMRSRLELAAEGRDSGDHDNPRVAVKGTQLQIEVTYLGEEVQATHRLAKIKGVVMAQTYAGEVIDKVNKNGQRVIGKAKHVKTLREPLKPVQWDVVECSP